VAKELRHKSVGIDLTQVEWEAGDSHEIDGSPAGEVVVTSVPPSGGCKILNVYFDPEVEKMIVEYEDIPIA